MIRILLAAVLFPAIAFSDEPIGDAARDLPIFDAHIHYKEPAWGPYPPETVIELMDRNGVAMGLVSSTPDQGTILLWEHAPNRIVPELRPYHGTAGSSNWMSTRGQIKCQSTYTLHAKTRACSTRTQRGSSHGGRRSIRDLA